MLYYYAARSGEGSFIRGSLQAVTAAEALEILCNRGLYVSRLDESASVAGAFAGALQPRSVSQKAVVAFFRSLAALTRAGVPLPRSLAICTEQTADTRLQEALRGVAAELQSGRSLSDAILTRPREFSQLAAATIRAGEQSGSLDEILGRLASGMERDHMLRKKLWSSLTYPAIVLAATVAVSILLLTTTVPVFQTMYEQLRVEVPPILRIRVGAGAVLTSRSFFVLAAVITGVALAIISWIRSDSRMLALVERIQLAVPITGTIARKAGAARVARLLGMLLGCGVSLHAAIPIAADAIHGARFQASLKALRVALFEGSSISPALEASEMYEPFFVQLVRAGEESGTVGEMLVRIGEHYEIEVEAALQQLGAALEPVIIVVLGGIVGSIAAAIFIPLYSLIGSIK